MSKHAVIIGGSHAGGQLALSLRQAGWEGSIEVVTDEAFFPYHRPPLSKDFLSGNKTINDLLIRQGSLYEKNNIRFSFDTTATKIDRSEKQIELVKAGKSHHVHYDKLALCLGARVRPLPLPGAELSGVHYLRTIADVEKIKQDIPASNGHGVIIGGGYIGLETAAMLRKMNVEVTVLEATPQLLGRVAAPEIGSFYHAYHAQHGVTIKMNAQVTSFSSNNDNHVCGVEFADGSALPADFIIIGIGVIPNTELALEAGLVVDNGIVVDEFGVTSDPDIVAAGDCTSFMHPRYGKLRLESVPNATEQAKSAAASLCGQQKPHHSLPWFWSDQYDCKLQIAGINRGYDEIIVRGDATATTGETPSFCIFYLQNKALIAADCINRPREFMLSRMWLQANHTPDLKKLADDSVDLTKDD